MGHPQGLVGRWHYLTAEGCQASYEILDQDSHLFFVQEKDGAVCKGALAATKSFSGPHYIADIKDKSGADCGVVKIMYDQEGIVESVFKKSGSDFFFEPRTAYKHPGFLAIVQDVTPKALAGKDHGLAKMGHTQGLVGQWYYPTAGGVHSSYAILEHDVQMFFVQLVDDETLCKGALAATKSLSGPHYIASIKDANGTDCGVIKNIQDQECIVQSCFKGPDSNFFSQPLTATKDADFFATAQDGTWGSTPKAPGGEEKAYSTCGSCPTGSDDEYSSRDSCPSGDEADYFSPAISWDEHDDSWHDKDFQEDLQTAIVMSLEVAEEQAEKAAKETKAMNSEISDYEADEVHRGANDVKPNPNEVQLQPDGAPRDASQMMEVCDIYITEPSKRKLPLDDNKKSVDKAKRSRCEHNLD